MAEREITVAVVSHKLYRMPNDPVYLPLHVGAALHPDMLSDWAQDNTGENISSRNGKYSELTGLYWLWKNCDSDYIGLVHYRRHFASPSRKRRTSKDRFDRVASGSELESLLHDVDIIVPRHRNYVIETIYSHYAHTFPVEHLNAARAIIAERCPGYLTAFDRVMKGTKAHMFNMFVMRRDLLNEYCAWLFPILFELENRIDDSPYDAFNLRYSGRVSEMLLDVWLYGRELSGQAVASKDFDEDGAEAKVDGHVRVAELPVVSPEPVDWPAKIIGFLNAKFCGKKYSKSF